MVESVQYNSALAITGAIRDSSREKLYQELGFESIRDSPLYLTEYNSIFEHNAFLPITLQMFLSSELNVLSQHFPHIHT